MNKLLTSATFAALHANDYAVILSEIDPSNGRTVTTATGYDYPTTGDQILYQGNEFYPAQDAALDQVHAWEAQGYQVSEYEQGHGSCPAPTLRIMMTTQGCLTRYFYAQKH